MLSLFLKWLGGGPLDRILSTVENKFDNDTERQKVRGDVIRDYVRVLAETRQTAMQSRFFWYTWLLFAAPLGIWWALVNLDSAFDLPIVVHDLPDSVKPYANQIFNAVFGSGAGVASIQAISSAIRGRR